ncbi:unnamed protein product [Rangifer tarandus platyrhynchus]|uniref:Uncharacterized protein n=2 Tax=Rangifer tarandus platyrhynchus TaxID=3082113 RepID=A0ACB0FH70_RANTA|nr:unnamed protein product [Rangifer tarandus platyrhynchus]CAI9712412.1 unnamed protein product [Rangifer tarandus platyrhynchus]
MRGGRGRRGRKGRAGARAGGAIVGPAQRARLSDVGENAPVPLCAQGQPGMFPPQDFPCELLHRIRAPPGRSRRAREGRQPPQLSRVRRGIWGSRVRPQEKHLLFSLLEAEKSD